MAAVPLSFESLGIGWKPPIDCNGGVARVFVTQRNVTTTFRSVNAFYFLISDVTSTTNGESSSVNRDSNEKLAPSENPSAPDKQVIGNEGIRSKNLFDVEGTIDFDFCENGDIDLR